MNAIFKKKICIETVVDAIVFNAFISSGRKYLHIDLENVRTIKGVKNKSNAEQLNYVWKKERKRDLAGLFFLFFFFHFPPKEILTSIILVISIMK